MAKARTNYVIKEGSSLNLLQVWTPAPAKAKRCIEAIEGVVRVYHFKDDGYLNVWLNPCYSKSELKAEIRATLSEQQQDRICPYREEPRCIQWPCWGENRIADMKLGEIGYIVSWAVSDWSGPHTLNGLNLDYFVDARKCGTADTPICRTRTGWVVGGKVFSEGVHGGTIGAMHPGEAGYVVSRALDNWELDRRYTVFRNCVPPADTHICRTNSGWVVGGKVFTESKIKDRLKLRPPRFPHWAESRSLEWEYTGWIKRPPAISAFEDLVAGACQSDHGEIRGVDIYPEGATCWMKERSS